jgi:hypothetical protein
MTRLNATVLLLAYCYYHEDDAAPTFRNSRSPRPTIKIEESPDSSKIGDRSAPNHRTSVVFGFEASSVSPRYSCYLRLPMSTLHRLAAVLDPTVPYAVVIEVGRL